jgi:hypothetical protein
MAVVMQILIISCSDSAILSNLHAYCCKMAIAFWVLHNPFKMEEGEKEHTEI